MKLLLLSPCPQINTMETTQYPPMGLLYIGAAVKDYVNELKILDANVLGLSFESTIAYINKYKPDVLGVSINVATAKISKKIIRYIKQWYPHIKTVAGGPLPTISPHEWMDNFDVVIAGEGEKAFVEIAKYYRETKMIKVDYEGVCFTGGKISRACQIDVNELSFPAYDHLVPDLSYYSKKARVIKKYMAPILTSRGCPYSCTFCDKSVHGKRFRARSSTSVINEIKWLYEKYNVRQIDILDDNFTFDRKRAIEIFDGIIKIGNIKINCQNGLRADKIDENLVAKMKRAGVFRVGIGIESGNINTLKQLKKDLNLDDVVKAIKLLRRYKITTQGYFIIGLPFETSQDIEDTISFAKKANPTFANFAHYFPIIGTPMYMELEKHHKLLNESAEIEDGFFRSTSYVINSNISQRDISKLYSKSWTSFYFRPLKVIDIIISIKSYRELLWIIRVSYSMLKSKIFKGTIGINENEEKQTNYSN